MNRRTQSNIWTRPNIWSWHNVWTRTLAAVLLTLFLCQIPVFAVVSTVRKRSDTTLEHAQELAALHLFRGIGTTEDGEILYTLDETPTRLQGLIMLVRLLGAEDEAVNLGNLTPFLDLSGGSAGYVSYAYRDGITKGTTETTFTPGVPLTARTYVTFLLRALGYSEQDGDFPWGEQVYFASSLGIMTRQCAQNLEYSTLTRGDMVDLSYAALSSEMKGEDRTLAEKLLDDGVFTPEEGNAAGVLGKNAGWTMGAVYEGDPVITYEERALATSEGTATVHVLRVDTENPRLTARAVLVDGQIGHSAPFSQIIEDSGNAAAILNANFFSVNSSVKTPLGHLMSEGEFLYADSGLSSLGIGADGRLQIGRPAVLVRLRSDGDEWLIHAINVMEQTDSASILYTPACGEQITMQNSGWTLVAEDGVITEFYSVSAKAVVTVPANGYVVYMGFDYAQTPHFRFPQKGEEIEMEYCLDDGASLTDGKSISAGGESFTLDGVESIISGAPRLVKGGEMETALEEDFTGSRFTTLHTSRSAVGIDRTGKLVLVCVPDGANMWEMRELMLELDCVEAFNLDGSASCAMYYQGTTLAEPARELTSTLQIFVEDA